jgi:hypothetical protein
MALLANQPAPELHDLGNQKIEIAAAGAVVGDRATECERMPNAAARRDGDSLLVQLHEELAIQSVQRFLARITC